MNKKRLHTHKVFAVLMLWVFAIALVPWSTLHHHEELHEYCAKDGKLCMHKAHIGNEKHNCLICSAHFEKDYYIHTPTFHVQLSGTVLTKTYTVLGSSYSALRGTSLRGPPAA